MAERLFGLETEYAFALCDKKGHRLPQAHAIEWLMEAAQRHLVHLPGICSSGMFLENGARFYVDCGRHPELTTPECANPWDAARYIRAGENILTDLVRQMVSETNQIAEAYFFRHNVDYSGMRTTWGSHESYLHRADPQLFLQHLIPHLVSRQIYTGSGGFDSRRAGVRFMVSPRVAHLECDVSLESTNSRGILNTRDETLSSRGYHRLHLLCSESLFSELAIFLRVGVTAIVVAMIEAGLCPGEGVELAASLKAMKAFTSDPECKATAAGRDRRRLTAVSIQRHYLQLAERHLHDSFMPPWADEVCQRWRDILDLLDQGAPHTVSARLDWAVKWQVFDDFIRRQGYSRSALEKWSTAFDTIVAALSRREIPLHLLNARFLLAKDSPVADVVSNLTPTLKRIGVSWDGLEGFLALREQLFEIDTRFSQLGGQGIFSTLEHAGVLQQHLPGVDNLEHAMHHPPEIGRAALRGDCVRRFGRRSGFDLGHACDWTRVWDQQNHRVLDLSDPFNREEKWQELPEPPASPKRPRRSAADTNVRRLMAFFESQSEPF